MIKVIIVAGGSGSGKTTLAKHLGQHLAARGHVQFLQIDHYYKDLSHLELLERRKTNFDHPDALDLELFADHLAGLKAGREIERPSYCFKTHTRGEAVPLSAEEYVLVEGIFGLYSAAVRALADFSIFVDVPDEVRYQRRLERDVRERGRTVEEVERQYAATVRPMYEQYVAPNRDFGHRVATHSEQLAHTREELAEKIFGELLTAIT